MQCIEAPTNSLSAQSSNSKKDKNFTLGTAHYLCLRLGPKGSGLGEWFFGQPKGWVHNFFASQRFNGILLIALYRLGSYYFIVHKVG